MVEWEEKAVEANCAGCNRRFDHDGVWFPAYCPECEEDRKRIENEKVAARLEAEDIVRKRKLCEPADFYEQFPFTYSISQEIARVTPIIRRVKQTYREHSMLNRELEDQLYGWMRTLDEMQSSKHFVDTHAILVQVIEWGLGELVEYVPRLEYAEERMEEQGRKLIEYLGEIDRIEADYEGRMKRVQQMAWQPSGPASVTLPEQIIQVRSRIQQVVLRLMAQEGLARSWRIQQRVIEAGMTQNENSVRNVLCDLTKKELVSDYYWNGHKEGWSPVPGGQRRLVTLTEKGRAWCRQEFREDAMPSEIAPMAKKHNSVVHAVGILEARDHLQARGYQVNDAPDPILAEEGQRWGRRVEPDLTVEMDGQTWPVEVQREVSPRHTAKKWAKMLGLTGRLALILFSEEKLNQQVEILDQAIDDLPAGEIKLISLEAMEGGLWGWTSIASLGDR